MSKSENIVLWGYYGSNYGDNIMFYQIMECLSGLPGIKKIYTVSRNPNIKTMVKKYPQCEVIVERQFTRYEREKWLRTFPKKSLHIWGGGTIFTDEEGDGNFYPFLSLRCKGQKFCYLSCGIGKLTTPVRILKTKLLLKSTALATFRDERSYQKAMQLSGRKTVVLTDDVVLNYAIKCHKQRQCPNLSQKNTSPYLLFSWRNLSNYIQSGQQAQLLETYIARIAEIANHSGIHKVIGLPLDTQTDVEVSKKICTRLQSSGLECEVRIENDVETVTDIISNAAFYFSGRLHGSMIAEALKIPTFTFSYSPKIDSFYESIGKKNWVNVLTAPIPDAAAMQSTAAEPVEIEMLQKRAQAAMLNFQLLRQLIAQ